MALVLDVKLVKHFLSVVLDNFVVECIPHLRVVVECELLHVLSEFSQT